MMLDNFSMREPNSRSEQLFSSEGGSRSQQQELSLGDESGNSSLQSSQQQSSSKSVSTINLKPWDPETKYLTEMKKCETDKLYNEYFKQRELYIDSPSFYLDTCNYFFRKNLVEEGLTILTNIVELELESHQLLRIVGYKLDEINNFELCEIVFRKVLTLRPNEPQSYRDLALIVEKLGHLDEAIKLFYKVITGSYDSIFWEIELTALIEMNRLIAKNKLTNLPISIPNKFIQSTPVDLRIVMAWDTADTDIDLHVTEPSGAHVFYSNKTSIRGGLISRDFTQGYGPEHYMIRNGENGIYKIQAKYFSSQQQSLTGGTKILLSIFTHYGSENEVSKLITVGLSSNQEIIDIAETEFKKK